MIGNREARKLGLPPLVTRDEVYVMRHQDGTIEHVTQDPGLVWGTLHERRQAHTSGRCGWRTSHTIRTSRCVARVPFVCLEVWSMDDPAAAAAIDAWLWAFAEEVARV